MNSVFPALDIAAIKTDQRLQMRVALNDEHVDDLAEALAEGKSFKPPPVVFWNGLDYWLADGFHRLAAHIKAGLTHMRCEIRNGEFRDALRYALGANQHTSLKRTNADKRKAVEMALADEEIAKMSNRQIADLCGVSTWLVDDTRVQLIARLSQSSDHLTARISHLDDRTTVTSDDRKSPQKAAAANVPAATAEPVRRTFEPDVFEPPSEQTPSLPTTATPAAKQQNLTDPFGRPLTGDLVDVFEHRTAIMSMVAELEEVKGRIKNLHAHHGGEFMPWPAIEYQLSAAQKQLEATAPQAVCPECGGANPLRAICRTCDERGFVAVGRFTQLAPVLQQKAKAFCAERGRG